MEIEDLTQIEDLTNNNEKLFNVNGIEEISEKSGDDCELLKKRDSNEFDVKKLNEEILFLKARLKSTEEQCEIYKQKFGDIPTNLQRLNKFPDFYSRLTENQYLKKNVEIPDLNEKGYLPQENLQSPIAGPFFYEDKKSVYEGQYWQQKSHGFGKIMWANGLFYQGTWKNGNMDGFGLLIKPNGSYVLGEFSNNKLNGNAQYFIDGCNQYKGNWSYGKKNGKGKEITVTMTYEGDFIENKKTGHAVITFENDRKKYEGAVLDGAIQGQGKMVWKDGRIYEGYWKDGLMNGYGKFTYKNGDVYEGDYQNGEKSGEGVMSYVNGMKFLGKFDKGRISGAGKVDYNDGRVMDGTWENNQLVINN